MNNIKKLSVCLIFFVSMALFHAFIVSGDSETSENPAAVNETTLPDIDPIQIVKINEIDGTQDGDSIIAQFDSYSDAIDKLGISLLVSDLVTDEQYTTVEIETDNQSHADLYIYNYIIGDCSEFTFIEEWGNFGRYQTTSPGEIYRNTVSMEIRMALNEEQLQQGLGKFYLGNYTYLETYTSSQGWTVNLIGTIGEDGTSEPQSKKIAVFVADGIQYELSASVTTETMKEIVDSMKFPADAVNQ